MQITNWYVTGASPDAQDIVRFCGMRSPRIITTAHGAMYLHFHADSGTNTHDGFSLNYKVIEGSKISEFVFIF